MTVRSPAADAALADLLPSSQLEARLDASSASDDAKLADFNTSRQLNQERLEQAYGGGDFQAVVCPQEAVPDLAYPGSGAISMHNAPVTSFPSDSPALSLLYSHRLHETNNDGPVPRSDSVRPARRGAVRRRLRQRRRRARISQHPASATRGAA
eukprot:7899061-Pyramimonas_sp.AAC.2